MKAFNGYMRGVGMGSWLTNYKRSKVMSREQMCRISPGDWEHFDTYYTLDDFKRVADWGMDHVRLPFDQVIMEDCDKPFTYREKGLAYLDRAMEWCSKCGLNVMLNMHHAVGAYCDNGESTLFVEPEEQERFICLWEELERRYIGENCIFEILNEPVTADYESWNELASRTIRRLHAINPSRRLMVGSVRYNSPAWLSKLRTYNDDRIVYNFHFYSPTEFTHQRCILNTEQMIWNRVMPYPGKIDRYLEYREYMNKSNQDLYGLDCMDHRYIERCMQPVLEFMDAHPDEIICCNEFSCMSHIELRQREDWYRDVIAFCLKHNIGYSAWNYMHTPYDGTKASLVREDTREILSPRLLRILQGLES